MKGLTRQAVGEDLAGARLPGRDRLSGKGRPADDLDALGFNLVGYGCTTCIGNSGPLPGRSGESDRGWRPRVLLGSVGQPQLRRPRRPGHQGELSRLAAAGRRLCDCRQRCAINLTKDPLGTDKDGNPVYLKDIWPSNEIAEIIRQGRDPEMFAERYSDVFKGDEHWQGIEVSGGQTYSWPPASTYVQNPPYFEGMTLEWSPTDVKDARVLACSATRSPPTTSLRPVRSRPDSPAGIYLQEHQVARWTSTPTARAAATMKS
jgi:aconitate hydratase